MPFEKKAFLGTQIDEVKNQHKLAENNLYLLMYRLNEDLNQILYNLSITNEKDVFKDKLLIGILCKIIQSLNGVIILGQYGLQSDAKTVLRSMLESSFQFSALIYDDSYLEDYLARGDIETLDLHKKILKNKELFNNDVLELVNEESISKLNVVTRGKNNVSLYNLAKKAKMTELYVYTYNSLSLDAHGNVKAVFKNHLVENESDYLLEMAPKFNELKFLYLTALSVTVAVLNAINYHFNEDCTEIIDKYSNELSYWFKES